MKKIFLGFLVFLGAAMLFNSCLTFDFSEQDSNSDLSSNGVKVTIDNFSQSKTYLYSKAMSDGHIAFSPANPLSTVDYLHLLPSLVVDSDGVCTAFVKIEFVGQKGSGWLSTSADKPCKEFIFLNEAETQRLSIKPIIGETETSLSLNDSYTKHNNLYITKDYKNSYTFQISMDKFRELRKFFENAGKVQCAVYTSKNIAKVKSYNHKWHQEIFGALEDKVIADGCTKFNDKTVNVIIELK